jgi:hypothetical protein
LSEDGRQSNNPNHRTPTIFFLALQLKAMTDIYVPTPEERAQHYSAALDSVDLINKGKPTERTEEDWVDSVKRNVEHLEIMVAKDFWVNEDMKPLNDAIAAGNAIIG